MSYHLIVERGASYVSAINASGEAIGASGGDFDLWSNTGAATILQQDESVYAGAVNALNNAGESVGDVIAVDNGPPQAMLWSPSGSGIVLGTSGSDAVAINASGESVGYQSGSIKGPYGNVDLATKWSSTGVETLLPLPINPDGANFATAVAINASGWIVGEQGYNYPTDNEAALLWSPSGIVTVLQDVGGFYGDSVVAINNAGQSIGYSEDLGDGATEAVKWSKSGVGTVLGGTGLGLINGVDLTAINASGQVSGYVVPAGVPISEREAVLWSSTGAETVLQDKGGENTAQALDLNNSGYSVGFVATPTGNEATLWSPKGTEIDLNRILGPAWWNTEATGINNAGDIVGNGYGPGGGMTSFLLMHAGGATSEHYSVKSPHEEASLALAARS